jgi:hypothetical protein
MDNNYQLKLEAPWEEVKGMLQEINLSLTDEDLSYQPGNEKEKKCWKDYPKN